MSVAEGAGSWEETGIDAVASPSARETSANDARAVVLTELDAARAARAAAARGGEPHVMMTEQDIDRIVARLLPQIAEMVRRGVSLSDEDVDRIVVRVVPQVALVMSAGASTPLLSLDDLAQTLGVGPATVRRRVAEGMPMVHVGDLPRFDLAACRAWLATRPKRRPKKTGKPAPDPGGARELIAPDGERLPMPRPCPTRKARVSS
jgi:hypothetical protein